MTLGDLLHALIFICAFSYLAFDFWPKVRRRREYISACNPFKDNPAIECAVLVTGTVRGAGWEIRGQWWLGRLHNGKLWPKTRLIDVVEWFPIETVRAPLSEQWWSVVRDVATYHGLLSPRHSTKRRIGPSTTFEA